MRQHALRGRTRPLIPLCTGAKSTALQALVKSLKDTGVPIDGVGIQAHMIVGELPATLQENMEAFAAIFQASPGTRPGVPTFFIPRPDGRLTMLVGYEAGDEAKVEAVLRGVP